MILFVIGLTMLLFHRNLIHKIIGMNIMDTGSFLFLASMGYIKGRKAPILTDGVREAQAYINPVPAGLVLTGIVVSVSCFLWRSGSTGVIIRWIWTKFMKSPSMYWKIANKLFNLLFNF